MKMTGMILLLASTLGIAAITFAQTSRPATQPTAGTPINKFCPINRGDTIDPKLTVTYKGQIIGFCCEDCMPTFNKDPEAYMKGLK